MRYFKKQNKIFLIFCLLVFSLTFLPSLALAGRIFLYPEIKEIYKDDVFVMEVRISNVDETINAAEGVLFFDKDKLEVKELSAGSSVFSLWPEKPVFSNEEGRINFVAGRPNGFQGENASVLKIIFLAKNKGEAKLDFGDTTSFFLADGKGTPVSPWLKSLTLNILEQPAEVSLKNEWQSLKESDKISPEPFEITLGREPAIFNNQYFISFFATDKESGIDRYEIQEGNEPYIAGESPYLLKDQKLKNIIRVKAIDKAGNERIAELMPVLPPVPFYKNVLFLAAVVLIIALVIIYILWRKRDLESRK